MHRKISNLIESENVFLSPQSICFLFFLENSILSARSLSHCVPVCTFVQHLGQESLRASKCFKTIAVVTIRLIKKKKIAFFFVDGGEEFVCLLASSDRSCQCSPPQSEAWLLLLALDIRGAALKCYWSLCHLTDMN